MFIQSVEFGDECAFSAIDKLPVITGQFLVRTSATFDLAGAHQEVKQYSRIAFESLAMKAMFILS